MRNKNGSLQRPGCALDGVRPNIAIPGRPDQPNGWAPLQWIAIVGLNDYHLSPLAQIIAPRWTCENLAGYQRSGTLVEKCDLARGGGKGLSEPEVHDRWPIGEDTEITY